MLYPEIFKPEDLSFGNRSPNLNLARNVVRGGSSHWKKQSVREVTCPVGGCEHPVYLLKEGSTLHIAPGKVSSFEGDLKQTQVTYDFIEDHHVIHISTISISIRYKSVEVEIPANIQFSSALMSRLLSQCTKLSLSGPWQGPYTDDNV